MVDHSHNVVVRFSTPIPIDFVDKFLPVARGSTRIGHHDQIAGRREHLRVPAVGPCLAPCTLRTSMDEKEDWVFSGFAKSGRFHDEGLNSSSVRRVHPYILERSEHRAR